MYIETASDLNKKWQESYCLYDGEPMYVLGCDSTPAESIRGGFAKIDNSEYQLSDVNPTLFEPLNIENGFYNLELKIQPEITTGAKVSCWKVLRNPRRSPTRGITRNTYWLLNPLEKFIGNYVAMGHPAWDFKKIMAMLHPKYYQYVEVFTMDLSKLRMVAIDSQWGLCVPSDIDPPKGGLLLSSYYGFCGWSFTDHIKIYHQGSYQEVLDFVRKSRLDVDVIYAGT